MSVVQVVVGNEYRQIPDSRAVFDRSGQFRKVHDATLYVDVVEGDPNVVDRVTFDLGRSFQPNSFTCSSPVPVTRPNGLSAWRFSTRQQVYGGFSADVIVRGCGGSRMDLSHRVILSNEANTKNLLPKAFTEHRGIQPLRMRKLPESQRFGIELELTSEWNVSSQDVANLMPMEVEVVETWRAGRSTSSYWKIVPDSSIVCSPHQPSCNKFEIVSPVLRGGNGLTQVSKVLCALPQEIQVNKSMGFHVHIDVSDLSLPQLIKVCQQFVKYEAVMDSFMPKSRRTGSTESDRYFQSNRQSVGGDTMRQVLAKLGGCGDVASLVRMMNRHGRYYKLNLENLHTGRQATIEFRQHSSTANYNKVAAWVRFCVWFVLHAAQLQAPKPFAKGRSLDEKFDALFYYVIKDRALRDFYIERRQQVNNEEDPCCDGCAAGGSCART